MANARYTISEVNEPVVSTKRQPRAAVIPPFSFQGELDTGNSGVWYPTSTIVLTAATFSASAAGTLTAKVFILRQEPLNVRPIVVGGFNVPATTLKQKITFGAGVLLSPYDKIFMTSFTDSGHVNVVIQLVGDMMT